MSYFGKNIRNIRNVKEMSQQAFAGMFELKRGTLGAYEEGRSEPRIETIIKIASHFNISIDDLLTTELTINKLLKFKNDLAPERTLNTEYFPEVSCIVPASEQDYIRYFDKPHFIEGLPCLRLPVNPDRKFRAYVLTNMEMTGNDRSLRPNDIVIGEKIATEKFSNIESGSLVLGLMQDWLFLRKFYISGEKVILRAANKDIDDTEIKLADLKELWLVKYSILSRAPGSSSALANKLDYLEQEFKKLKEQL
ncbi:helix-turn-helix domain-containing protein [Autumnicola musiva]|uniref:Helix-turn-helix transcriptional regulator n=1 Tax=Autumnicola musiva TaxID=3075589 RepID=A0ABU3D7L6_9FLAO|nr:helix-turn-helix transcriptional regulator [Zunongwangia sp. F117]MDT0677535.1 helix-turn-helix transcriptional regulator [Zunongwangia sp. F117]